MWGLRLIGRRLIVLGGRRGTAEDSESMGLGGRLVYVLGHVAGEMWMYVA